MPPLMIYSLTADDIPPLSQWIKKSKSEDLDFLVEVTGFEPATSASRTQRSTKLSHTSIYDPVIIKHFIIKVNKYFPEHKIDNAVFLLYD